MEALGDLTAGRASPVRITSTVTFVDDNASKLSGFGLWRMGIFGSMNEDGTGDRFGYISQVLNSTQAAAPISEDNLDLQVVIDFLIADVGCNSYRYTCIEFARGRQPFPMYRFRTDSALSNSDTTVICGEQDCIRGTDYFLICIALRLFIYRVAHQKTEQSIFRTLL